MAGARVSTEHVLEGGVVLTATMGEVDDAPGQLYLEFRVPAERWRARAQWTEGQQDVVVSSEAGKRFDLTVKGKVVGTACQS